MAGKWQIEYRVVGGRDTGTARWWADSADVGADPPVPPSFSFTRGNLQASDKVPFLTECVQRRNAWQTEQTAAAAKQAVADVWATELNVADPQSEN